MPRQSFNDPNHAHYLTFSCYRRQQLFTNDELMLWFTQELDSARKKEDFAIWAYVIMPEHVHLMIHPLAENYSMERIHRRIKETFSHRVVRHWRDANAMLLQSIQVRSGQRLVHRFWQAGGGFDRNLYDLERIRRGIVYIEYNPVRRGLVQNPIGYIWSSARSRTGVEDVPLIIDLIEF